MTADDLVFTSIYKSIVGLSGATGAFVFRQIAFRAHRRVTRRDLRIRDESRRIRLGAPRERNALIGFTAGDPLSI